MWVYHEASTVLTWDGDARIGNPWEFERFTVLPPWVAYAGTTIPCVLRITQGSAIDRPFTPIAP